MGEIRIKDKDKRLEELEKQDDFASTVAKVISAWMNADSGFDKSNKKSNSTRNYFC